MVMVYVLIQVLVVVVMDIQQMLQYVNHSKEMVQLNVGKELVINAKIEYAVIMQEQIQVTQTVKII